MKNIRFFLSKSFYFLVVKFSVYLIRHVFVMCKVAVFLHAFICVMFQSMVQFCFNM